VTGLAFAPGGEVLYSTSWDGSVRRWEVASGKELRVADGYSGGLEIAYASDGKRLASTADGAEVHVWDAVKGRRARVLEGDPAGSSSVALSPDGRILAAGGCGLTVWLWHAATGQPIRHWSWPKGKEPYNCAERLAFSPDGRTLATIEFRANRVQLWEVQSGKRQALLTHEMVHGVAFSPDGRTLVTGGWDQALRLWELPSGKLRETYFLPGKPDPHKETYRDPRIEYVVYSPDGRLLATWQLDGSICLWRESSGKVISKFKAAQGQGPALAFSPDGMWLACVGDDNAVWVCEPRSGQVVLRLAGHQGGVCSLAYSPDGRTLVSGSRDNTGLLWSLRPPEPSTPRDIESLWGDLGRADALAAYQAVWRMAEAPDEALPLLRQRLKPIQSAPEETTRQLVADLDSDSFQRREEAAKRLRQLGEVAEPALRKAMEARPSLEQKRRLEALLATLDETGALSYGEAIRQQRAVAVLQRIDTPKSRDVLERLAGGLSSAALTQQAKAALARAK
jgi:WD40 repeat protein